MKQSKTAVGETKALNNALAEFKSDYQIKFILFQLHNHLDGILWLNDKLHLNMLFNRKTEIPIQYN